MASNFLKLLGIFTLIIVCGLISVAAIWNLKEEKAQVPATEAVAK